MTYGEKREAKEKVEQHVAELMKICEKYDIESIDIRATNHGYGSAFGIDHPFMDIIFMPTPMSWDKSPAGKEYKQTMQKGARNDHRQSD